MGLVKHLVQFPVISRSTNQTKKKKKKEGKIKSTGGEPKKTKTPQKTDRGLSCLLESLKKN